MPAPRAFQRWRRCTLPCCCSAWPACSANGSRFPRRQSSSPRSARRQCRHPRRRAGRWRSPPRGWGRCGTGCAPPTTSSGSPGPPAGIEVFRQLVLARIIEPTSKLDSLRVLAEVGVDAAVLSPRSTGACRSTPRTAFRRKLAAACAAHARLGPASLVLYDVSHALLRDRRRRRVPRARVLQGTPPGAADHHRPAHRRGRVPADGRGVRGQHAPRPPPCCPTIRAFMAAHQLADVTIVADAGMVSAAQQAGDRGRGAVVHPRREDPRHPLRRAAVAARAPRRADPRRADPHPALARRARPTSAVTRSSTTSTGPTGPAARCAASTSRSPRPRRPSPGRRRSSATGSSASSAPTSSVNRTLEAKARALAGWKGYITNLATCPDGTPVTAEFVIDAYHRLFQIEALVPDVQARPGRPADLPPQARVDRGPPDASCSPRSRSAGWSRSAPAGRSASSSAPPAATAPSRSAPAQQLLTADDPLPDDLREALALIIEPESAH